MIPFSHVNSLAKPVEYQENALGNRGGIKNNTDESVPIHFNQPKDTSNDVYAPHQ